ncbi:hypothetical protein [uncultured Winogradskyella sp.]|uniref:hypothetical protein n=1 Tax=uncultured Winogradskyella sp. TaxID=395353 RepID=UPI00262FBAEB|nr:hypothetical protein [uncultured Winogradskyella sp.]
MSKIQFEIFKDPKDYKNWNKHIEFAQKTTGFDKNFKLELENAYTFLKTELGKGFLKNQSGSSVHPIINRLANRTEESFLWFIWLAKSLKQIKSACNKYDALRSKLNKGSDFKAEGLPFIQIISKFIDTNFEITIEPFKEVKGSDLKIVDLINNETFYIEVTRLNDSEERISNRRNYHNIFGELSKPPIKTLFSGKILKSFDQKRLNEIMIDLKSIKERVSENELIEYYSNSDIDIAITNLSNEQELMVWSESKKYPFLNIESIDLNFNEIDRIINNKLGNKANQNLNQNNVIIYIPLNPLFLYLNNPIKSINKIQSKLSQLKFDNILGVYIQSEIGISTENKILNYRKHVYGSRKSVSNYREDFLFIINENCSKKINQKTLEKIYTVLSS